MCDRNKQTFRLFVVCMRICCYPSRLIRTTLCRWNKNHSDKLHQPFDCSWVKCRCACYLKYCWLLNNRSEKLSTDVIGLLFEILEKEIHLHEFLEKFVEKAPSFPNPISSSQQSFRIFEINSMQNSRKCWKCSEINSFPFKNILIPSRFE